MSDYDVFWKDRNEVASKAGTYCNAQNFGIIHPSVNAMEKRFIQPNALSKSGFTIKGNTYIKLIDASGTHFVFGGASDMSVANAAQKLDTGSSLTAGRDYYVYLCLGTNASGETAADIVVSLNSTFPSGYNAYTSRKIGGFHTLCAAAKGYAAGDIIPISFWCLTHRPTCSPEGMAYVDVLDAWYDIYKQSGTGTNTSSVYGGTITHTRNYMDFVDDLAAVGKTMISDEEFQVVAEGSNQQTNIVGSTAPVTTGGHTDTAGARMVSNFWLEDCCGALWQWVTGGGWRYTGTAAQGETFSPMIENPTTDWPGGKGQIYWSEGRSGLIAGGAWNSGANCGSRARNAVNSRRLESAYHGCRGRARNV